MEEVKKILSRSGGRVRLERGNQTVKRDVPLIRINSTLTMESRSNWTPNMMVGMYWVDEILEEDYMNSPKYLTGSTEGTKHIITKITVHKFQGTSSIFNS